MTVRLEITFGRDEILKMCLEKCSHIETAVEGTFEARASYLGEVICTFVPRDAADPEYGSIEPPPAPILEDTGAVVMDVEF